MIFGPFLDRIKVNSLAMRFRIYIPAGFRMVTPISGLGKCGQSLLILVAISYTQAEIELFLHFRSMTAIFDLSVATTLG